MEDIIDEKADKNNLERGADPCAEHEPDRLRCKQICGRFTEEDVSTAAEEIVGLATMGDYDSIILSLRDDLKSGVWRISSEGWASIYEKAGAFDSITKTVFSEPKTRRPAKNTLWCR